MNESLDEAVAKMPAGSIKLFTVPTGSTVQYMGRGEFRVIQPDGMVDAAGMTEILAELRLLRAAIERIADGQQRSPSYEAMVAMQDSEFEAAALQTVATPRQPISAARLEELTRRCAEALRDE
jgi:hypothetical protein